MNEDNAISRGVSGGVAHQLLHEFEDRKIDRINECVDSSESETSFLEFKTSSTDNGQLTKDDLANLAKTLTAFANSEGGIQVWGIDAKRHSDGNHAVELKPIPDISKFYEAVNDALGSIAQPAVRGSRVLMIPTSGEDDSGFLVVFVPQSEFAPHMSMGSKQQKYFMRAGSQSVYMPHRIVEALILAQSGPKLEWDVSVEYLWESGSSCRKVRLDAWINNRGLGSAKFISFAFKISDCPLRAFKYLPNTRIGDSLQKDAAVLEFGPSGESHEAVIVRLPPENVLYPGSSFALLGMIIEVSSQGESDSIRAIAEDGFNVWLWAFSDNGMATYHVHRSRADLASESWADERQVKLTRRR